MSLIKTSSTPILTSPNDWAPWLASVKAAATAYDIWKYVEPQPEDLADENLTICPVVPSRPDMNNYHTTEQIQQNLRVSSAMHLNREARDAFRIDIAAWKEEADEAKQSLKALKELQSFMIGTTDIRMIESLTWYKTCYELFTHLKTQYSPSDESKKQDLRRRYEKLLEGVSGSDMEKWLDEWVVMYIDFRRLGMPEKDEIRIRFRQANRNIDSGWSYMLTDDKWRTKNFLDMVAKTREFYREDKPQLSRGNRDFTFAFATLGGRDQNNQNGTSSVQQTNRPDCLCGRNHPLFRCWYLNPNSQSPLAGEKTRKQGHQSTTVYETKGHENVSIKCAKEIIFIH